MNEQTTGAENQKPAPSKGQGIPPTPLDEVVARFDAQKAENAGRKTTEAKEQEKNSRLADIEACALECGCFGYELEQSGRIADILYTYECDCRADGEPDFCVIAEAKDDPDYVREFIIAPEMEDAIPDQEEETELKVKADDHEGNADTQEQQTAGQKVEADVQETKVDKQSESETGYAAFLEEIKKLPNTEKIRLIAGSPVVPDEERARAAQFARILEIAGRDKADAALVAQKINAQNFMKGVPDPVAFIKFDIFSSCEHDSGISEETQAAIAREFGIPRPPDVKANSDVRKLAKQTKTMLDPETGEERAEYVHDSEDNMAEFRPGVGTYMDGKTPPARMYLASSEGGFKRDVTNMSDNYIGLLAGMMHFHATTEHFGVTGFVECVARTTFSGLFTEAFEPKKLEEIRQVLNHLMGGFAGYDGRVFDAREKMPLIRAQMRALSADNQALPWRRDEEQTTKALERYGLYSGGKPNLDVIGAFGSYTQKYKTIEPSKLQEHLHELFPDIVEPPKSDAEAEPDAA